MGKSFLRAGARAVLDGEPYVFERQCSDGVWVLRHAHTERPIERTTEQIFDAYAAETLKFQNKELRTIANVRPRVREANKLIASPTNSKEYRSAKLRMVYVRATLGLPYTKTRMEQAIEQAFQSLKKEKKKHCPTPETEAGVPEPIPAKKPGWVSVYRWVRTYLESGESDAALMAAHSDKGNREPRYPKEVLEICADLIGTLYMSQERPTVQHVLNLAKAQTRAANKMLPKSGQLAMPSRLVIEGLIAKIPAYDRHAARYGREAARKKFRAVMNHRVTDAPLQRGEIDHTRMDVFVIDETHGLPLGRPWLTILIDAHTRCVLGYCLSFEPPSRATVARCLRHAFMPKTKLRAQYPDLKNDWSAFGIVSELVMDGGAEFYSEDLENICFELGIEQHFAPRKTPWFKGIVERFQGTLNRGVAITIPGKTFGDIFERGDYDPKKHAVITLSELRHLITRWIVDVYHQKKHSALDCSPAQMWASSARLADIPLMEDPLRFDAIMGGVANRKLSHIGIEYAGLQYNSPEMTDLRRHYGDAIKVDIRVDQSNLGSIIVLHPERGTPYRVPCLRPDYAEGLTKWQHDVCKRHTRNRIDATGDPDGWLDSLLEISEIVSREMKLGKKKGPTRERIARWGEGKQATTAQGEDLASQSSAQNPEPLKVAALDDALCISASPLPSLAAPTVARKHFAPVFEERGPIYPADKAMTKEEPIP